MSDAGEWLLSYLEPKAGFRRKPFKLWGKRPVMRLSVGDRVQLCGNPFDEQIPAELILYIFLKSKIMTVTEIGHPGDLTVPHDDNPPLDKFYVKTDMTPDWIAADWFVKL